DNSSTTKFDLIKKQELIIQGPQNSKNVGDRKINDDFNYENPHTSPMWHPHSPYFPDK
ncbi:26177_t:CDS:1, partial [Gigaspora margarita]